MRLSEGKIKHLNALSNDKGIIAAAAMDQRGSLRKAIATAKGVPQEQVSDEMMAEFKVAVSKILTPFEKQDINDIKHAFIERVGAECETYEIPFFLEFVGYDPEGGNEKGFDYAKKKPEIVIKSMQEFGKPQYRVDVLKVEVPVNAEFVEGSSVYKGKAAYSRKEALDLYRNAASFAEKPFIYLSAGVGNAQFVESLHMAAEAGTDYSGVLCGRATWKDGVP